MKRQFVVVSQNDDGMWCHGIFDDYYTALGHVMEMIWEFKESYKGEGDSFEFTEAYYMEGDGGYCVHVKFKHSGWEKECEEFYYILFNDEENEE